MAPYLFLLWRGTISLILALLHPRQSVLGLRVGVAGGLARAGGAAAAEGAPLGRGFAVEHDAV